MAHPTENEVKELETFLNEFSGDMLETTRDLIQENFTQYPIYIVHQEPVEFGQVILDRSEHQTIYSISISTLEEFLENGFLDENKKDEFTRTYGDPLKQMCVLWVLGDNIHFVFFPYANHVVDK